MTNAELIAALRDAVKRERHSAAEVVEHLAAFDALKLWRDEGFPHLFAYCREALGYSESAAGKRTYACRLAQRHKDIVPMLRAGTLHLEGLMALGARLDAGDSSRLLAEASGKSVRQIERMVAEIAPQPPKRDLIRGVEATPQTFAMEQRIEASAPDRSRVHFDADDEIVTMIERAREVLRHKYPFASVADVVREALKMLLDRRDPERELELDKPGRPRLSGASASEARRRIPRWVRKAVWARDGGRCAFVSEDGKRCGTRGWLEYDHVVPFAKGGRSDDPANVRLLCRHHSQLMAERHFGGVTELPLQ